MVVFRIIACFMLVNRTLPALLTASGLAAAIVGVTLWSAAFGIWAYIMQSGQRDFTARAVASGMPPTVMGMFLLLGSGFTVWWLRTVKSLPLAFKATVLALVSCALIMTFSRGPLAGAAFFFLWTLLSRRTAVKHSTSRYRVTVLAVLLVAALGVTLLTSELGVEIARRLGVAETVDSRSVTVRFALWQEATDLIKTSPIAGLGFLRYPELTMLHSSGTFHCHNLFLQTWIDFGLVGLIALVAIVAPLVRRVFGSDSPKDSLGGYLAAISVGFLISQLVDDGFLYQKVFLMFWIVVFVYYRLVRLDRSARLVAQMQTIRAVFPRVIGRNYVGPVCPQR
jgi:O-antigen ligase